MSSTPVNVNTGDVHSFPPLKANKTESLIEAQPVSKVPINHAVANVLGSQQQEQIKPTLFKEALKKLNLTEQQEQEFNAHLQSALKPEDENLEELFKQLKIRTDVHKGAGTNENLIESLLEVEQGGYKTTQLTLAAIKETRQFERLLGAVLPPVIKEKYVSSDRVEKFEKLSAILIGAIHQGFKGIALVARTKLLKEHKELIADIKEKIKASGHGISKNDLRELKKTLDEMSLRVKVEEKELKVQWGLLGVTGATSILSFLTLPLDYFPRKLLPSDEIVAFSKEILKGMGWGVKGIEIALLSVDLAMKYKAHSTFEKWKTNFEEESVKVQPRVVIEESREGGGKFTTRRVEGDLQKLQAKKTRNFNDFIDFKVTSPLNGEKPKREEIEKRLLSNLEKAETIEKMREIFSTLNTNIPEGLNTCDEVRNYYAAHPNEWNHLVDVFVGFANIYHNYRVLEANSRDLLTKRENQTKRQVMELLPLFSKMEDKVEKAAKEGFDKRIDGLIEKITPHETRKPSEILDQLSSAISKGIIKKKTPLYDKFEEGRKLSIKKTASKAELAEFRTTLLATLKAAREANPKNRTRELDAFLDSLIGTPSIATEEGFTSEGNPTRSGAAFLDAVSKLIQEGIFEKDSDVEKAYSAIVAKVDDGSPKPHNNQLFNGLKAAVQRLKSDSNEREHLFNQWYHKKTPERKLSDYIDHQNVLDHVLKNSLRDLIKNKQTLEKKFLGFTLKSSTINYIGSTALFATSATFAILALIGNPVAGAAMILLFLSIGTGFTSLALMGASYAMAFKLRPSITAATFKGETIYALTKNLELGIKKFRLNSKEKSLRNTAKSIQALIDNKANKNQTENEYEKLINRFRKKKAELDAKKAKVAELENKVEALRKKSNQKAWEDFSKFAGFDGSESEQAYLASLAEGLEGIDEPFASEEIKRILRVQLAFGSLSKEPGETKEHLRRFFAQEDKEIVGFIRRQTARLEKKLIL